MSGCDISSGLSFEEKNPQFTGHVDLNYKDWVALIARVDVRNKVDLSPGIKLRSHAGSAVTVALCIAAVIAVSQLSVD